MDASDAELVGAVRRRPAAYRHLVSRHWERINRWLRQLVGCAQTADDLCQEAFIKAYQRLSSLKDPDKFGAWLRPIAMRCAQDWFRRQTRNALVSLNHLMEDGGRSLPDTRCEAPGAELEAAESLQGMIAGLSFKNREVIELRFREGLSYLEIAERLQIPEGTAAARLHRAVATLKRRHLQREVVG